MENIGPIQLLQDDHKRLKGLFRQFEATDLRAREMHPGVLRQLLMELEIHARVEEEIFYPAVSGLEDATLRTLVDSLRMDHQGAAGPILRIRDHLDNVEFLQQFVPPLIEDMETHIDREERELFPILHEFLQAPSDLAERMRRRREMLLRLPEYKDAQPEIVQDPNGGEQMRKVG
jgi:iron-sulfur cluster repair protein YtfE (RIC family)